MRHRLKVIISIACRRATHKQGEIHDESDLLTLCIKALC